MAIHQFGHRSALASARHRPIRSLILGVFLALVALISTGSVEAHPDARPTVHVLSHVTSFKSTQANPNVIAPGDELFIGGTVRRPAGPHNQIGTFGVHCVATGAGGSQILCDAAYVLPAGQITAQVLVATQLPSRFKVAITGGTGSYRNATGEATIVTLSQTDDDVTFRLGGGGD